MPVLRPITDEEFSDWLDQAVPGYAAEKVAAGNWPEAGALERSQQEHLALLPQGPRTPDHHFFSILDDEGAQVGTLWFAVKGEGEGEGARRVAYVYGVDVFEARRRQGHARRAFAALEDEVRRLGLSGIALHVFGHNTGAQALYAALGFRPTNINLYKALDGG
jgi:ribosomal protein S18 acetylase RimI-like enzyme